MKKVLVAVAAAALSLGALAFEKYMMRVPDELNAKEGFKGVTQEFAPATVSIPLKDGNWVYIVNETPKPLGEGGFAHVGEPKKVADLDVISRYRDAMKGFPSVAVQLGESTFFAYRTSRIYPVCEGLYLDNCYQGVVVSMGAEYSLTIFLPQGRGLDAEVRGLLKQVSLVPVPGIGVDTALKLYGKGSVVPAAARLKAVKKMVEERGECCELIELLLTLTNDAETKEWCRERLDFLNPGKYAGDNRAEIAEYDMKDKAQRKAIMAMLSARDRAEKAAVKVPAGDDGDDAAAVAAKTKTVMLPGGAKMEFIWCEKGVFTMGQNDGEWDPSKKEEPRRKITLTKGFWLAKYETTQGQWKSVMGENPSFFTGDDDLPVEKVSWNMCKEFAQKAGAAGVKLRLPTEAEWEYACRAGTRTAYYWGYQANTKKANYNGEDSFHPDRSQPTVGKTVKVGSYEPNPWGFFDMAGNVAEWCEDDWLREPPAESAKDPLYVQENGELKVYRGGSWDSKDFTCRAAERDWHGPKRKANNVGVRFVLEEAAVEAAGRASSPSAPPADATGVPPVASEQKPAASTGTTGVPPVAPQTTPVNAKTKTITLPGGATMEMIWCPAGTFMMGRNVDAPNGGDADVVKLHAGGGEVKPPIKVTLTKGFWLGKYEVTQAQYKGVMGENPSDSSAIGDNMPVNRVTWDDATKFLKKVGSGARLPTDAEWEYACKAGTDTAFPWGDVCNGQETNCNGTRPFGTKSKGPNIGRPVKVGSYQQNPWGFHDMNGNVSELCSDKFHAYLSTMEPRELVDPKGYPYTSQRTLRGGSYLYHPYGCRSVWRQSCPQDWPAPHIGFRMAMDE